MIKTNLVVVINGYFEEVAWRDFTVVAECAEAAYDIVAGYVAKGLVLQKVKVGHHGQWTDWPVAMFTHQSLEQFTQPMQQEWEAVLAPLPLSTQLRHQRKAFLRRQIRFYEQQIERSRQRITDLEMTRQNPIRFHDPALNESRTRQLRERLSSQQTVLTHLEEACQWTTAYLHRLELEPLPTGKLVSAVEGD